MKIVNLILVFSVVFLLSCSSNSKKNETVSEFEGPEREFQKDYVVVDAQYKKVPTWLNDPQKWAKSYDAADFKDMRYFTADAGPINHKGVSCQHAKAKATSDIASEITQFIKNSFAASAMGDPTDGDEALEEYVEDTLAKEVQTFVVGAKVHRTYWEKRAYKEELGANEDKNGYVCHALVKIDKKSLSKAIKRAQKKLEGVTNDTESKQKVQKALEGADKAFADLKTTKES